MEENTVPICPFCDGATSRGIKRGEDISADIVDCPACGIYEIGRTERHRMHSLRDEQLAKNAVAKIKSANADGAVFRYPSGGRILSHAWLRSPSSP